MGTTAGRCPGRHPLLMWWPRRGPTLPTNSVKDEPETCPGFTHIHSCEVHGGTTLPTHRLIQQTATEGEDQCDLCSGAKGTWVYRTQSEVTRDVRDDHQVIDSWAESLWLLCHVCSHFVETSNRMGLLTRLNEARPLHMRVTRRNIKLVASFMQQLLPGRERREITV